MYKVILVIFITFLKVQADEYDFDMESIEKKPYEYSGYLRLDDKMQNLYGDGDTQNYIHAEGLFNFSYRYEQLKLQSSFMGTQDYLKDDVNEHEAIINDLNIEGKLSTSHLLLAGKKSLMWGKGYFYNPVAFFDRPKDPLQPTQAREGYYLSKYNYNKSFNSVLKNLSFDLVYLPANDSLNKDYYSEITNNEDSNNIAARIYLLLYDTDIDFIYNYSDVITDKVGIDFSKNIKTNFEIHGEYANLFESGYSYLLGIRYLTEFELTIISEYLFQSNGLNEQEIQNSSVLTPFIAKDYFITLITQKEPFDLLYFSVYYKNMTNLQDYSQQNKIGSTYSFKTNIDLDISYNINSGKPLSEFGKKNVEDFLWIRATWNF